MEDRSGWQQKSLDLQSRRLKASRNYLKAQLGIRDNIAKTNADNLGICQIGPGGEVDAFHVDFDPRHLHKYLMALTDVAVEEAQAAVEELEAELKSLNTLPAKEKPSANANKRLH